MSKEKQNYMDILEKQMQEPCDDTISRKAAINAMIKIEQDDIDRYGCKIPEGFDSSPAVEALNGLPSVTPQLEKIRVANIYIDEEKFKEICKNATLTILDDSNTPTIQPNTGWWINDEDMTNWYDATYKCSCCGREIIIPYESRNDLYKNYPYCHCGAKMQEVEE